MSDPTSKITVQNTVTDTFRIVGYSDLNGSTRTIPWSVFKSDLDLGDDSVVTLAASQAISVFNTIYFVDASAGPITITLGTAANFKGQWVFFKQIDATVNTVTVAASLAETIDLDSELILQSTNTFAKITSDSVNWKITNA